MSKGLNDSLQLSKRSFHVFPNRISWVSLKHQSHKCGLPYLGFSPSPFVAFFVAHNTWWPVRLSRRSASVSPPPGNSIGVVCGNIKLIRNTSKWWRFLFEYQTESLRRIKSSKPEVLNVGHVLEIMHRYESSWSVHMHQTCSGKPSPQIVLTQTRAQSQCF